LEKLILILLCLLSGYLLRHLKIVKADAYKFLNVLLINFFMPAIILLQITTLKFEYKFIFPIIVAWIIFAVAFVFFKIIGKWQKIDPKSIATLIITAGISSTSFLGFPIFEMLYGNEGLQIAILMSQLGSFLIGITFGVAIASYYSSTTPTIKDIVFNIFKFPPFIAFIVAIFLNVFGIQFTNTINYILTKLSSPYLVLALLSAGMQITLSLKEGNLNLLGLGLLYKLILAPILIFILYKFAFIQSNFVVTISVMGAAIGSMNTAAIIADKFNLNSKLASQMVAISIPISLPILYFIHILLT
jgi:malate permease and related proteins